MKAKLIAIGAVAALIASPLSMADKADGGPAVCGVAHDIAEVASGDNAVIAPIVCEKGIVEITPIQGEGEPAPEKDPAVCDKTACEDAHEVPIDWVKRGGESELENPDVIFYTTGGGEGAPVAAKADIELGQDDKAAVIEGKGAFAPQVNREKKGPVALVKKGRVFLR